MHERGTRATPENRGAEAAAAYRGERGARREAAGRRPRQFLEPEDYLLAGWVLAVEEVVRRSASSPFELMHGGMAGDTGTGWWALLQSLTPSGWGVVALFLFVLLTRGPEDTDREVALQRRWPMLGLALPLLSLYALTASAIQHALFTIPERRDGEPPPWPGPFVPGVVRRTMAVPLAFLGDALFRSEVANANIADIGVPLDAAVLAPALMLALLSALPYMLFVAGPRIAAGAALAWQPWAIRFALFYLSSWFGSHVSR